MKTKLIKNWLLAGIGLTTLGAIGSTTGIFLINQENNRQSNTNVVKRIDFHDSFDQSRNEINLIIRENPEDYFSLVNQFIDDNKENWQNWALIIDGNGNEMAHSHAIESINDMSLISVEGKTKVLSVLWDIDWKENIKVNNNAHLTLFPEKLAGKPELKPINDDFDRIFAREAFHNVTDAATFQSALNSEAGKSDLADAIEFGYALDIGNVGVKFNQDSFDISIPFTVNKAFIFEEDPGNLISLLDYQIKPPVKLKSNFVQIVNEIPEFSQVDVAWDSDTWKAEVTKILNNNFPIVKSAVEHANAIEIKSIDIDIVNNQIPRVKVNVQKKPGFDIFDEFFITDFGILFDLEFSQTIDIDAKIREEVSAVFYEATTEAEATRILELNFAEAVDNSEGNFWLEIFERQDFISSVHSPLGDDIVVEMGEENVPGSVVLFFDTTPAYGYIPRLPVVQYEWIV